MSVYLIAVFWWSMAYRGTQATPMEPQLMPSMEACQAIGKVTRDMMKASDEKFYRYEFKCVEVVTRTPSESP